MGMRGMIRQSLAILFHPSDSFTYIKRSRGKFNYWPPFLLFFLTFVVRCISIYLEHFPMANILPRDANIWLEFVRVELPLFTWVIALYAMTTIMDGETTVSETFAATAYAMVPYIVLKLPVTLFSHLLGTGDSGMYTGLNSIIWGWVILLIFVSIMTMNEYSFPKTVLIVCLSVISVALIWAVSALFFAMTTQLVDFIAGIGLEIRMLLID